MKRQFKAKTRRVMILSVVLICCLAGAFEQWQIVATGLGGLLGLLKDDKDEPEPAIDG